MSPYAWGTIGVTTAFIGLTCWWLTQDRSIPIYDAGYHLAQAIEDHGAFASGDLTRWFTHTAQYPPLAYLVGALAQFVGGVSVAAPIIGENVVFVSLLALGCYQTGRLLFGARAGLLAVIFALGSPLLIAQFHVFMLDAPETALVAVSMWLLLASEDFRLTHVAAWAGVAVGCGLLVKIPFALFVAGIVLVALARGGWRRWRGLTAFAGIAFALAGSWYIDHIPELGAFAHLANTQEHAGPGALPATFSLANFTWYFWSTLNSQLYAPLFLLALAGSAWTIWALRRGRIARGPTLALLVGAFIGWVALTFTRHHDVRYGEPMIPYLAVLGTGWISAISQRAVRLAAIAVLLCGVIANTIATTFGSGSTAELDLVSAPSNSEAFPDRITLYSNRGHLVAGPSRDGDLPGLLSELRRDGVRQIAINAPGRRGGPSDFSTNGVLALVLAAHLKLLYRTEPVYRDATVAALVHSSIAPSAPSPCTRLSDGTGVWVARVPPATRSLSLYCPFRHPHFYPGAVGSLVSR